MKTEGGMCVRENKGSREKYRKRWTNYEWVKLLLCYKVYHFNSTFFCSLISFFSSSVNRPWFAEESLHPSHHISKEFRLFSACLMIFHFSFVKCFTIRKEFPPHFVRLRRSHVEIDRYHVRWTVDYDNGTTTCGYVAMAFL